MKAIIVHALAAISIGAAITVALIAFDRWAGPYLQGRDGDDGGST